jgi:hypothetical protein
MVVTTTLKPPPARDYPNINALQGIRYFYDSTPVEYPGGSQAAGSGLLLNKPVVIGTVPARSVLFGSTIHVKQPTSGASTLDVGIIGTPTKYGAAFPLNAAMIDDDFVTNAGYVGDADTPIILTLKGSDVLTGSIFSILLYYYSKID